MPVRLGAALVAEFVGTFALCCVGMLAIHFSGGLLTAVALGHGLILATLVTAAMPTSGGHFNPAVTFGFLITGKIKPGAGIAYIAIQLLASIVAGFMVYAMFGAGSSEQAPDGSRLAANIVLHGTPLLGASFSAAIGLLVEIVATFFLVFAVWGSAADPCARNVGGFAIGLTVAADILAFGPVSGAAMNPARAFGPALVASLTGAGGAGALWATHWIYWIGPLAGGGLAALIYHLVLWPRDPKRGIDPDAGDVPASQRP